MSAQRMTEAEAQAVIRLWQGEQAGVTDTPTLPDVAEGLDISVEDTHRLLLQVRAQRAEQEKLLAQDQAETELERIQLAEEERKLAEVRRQRAELQRQQAEAARVSQMTPQVYPKIEDDATKVFKAFFLGICLCIMLFIFSHALSGPGRPSQSPSRASCGAGYEPVPGHDASFGCMSVDTPMRK